MSAVAGKPEREPQSYSHFSWHGRCLCSAFLMPLAERTTTALLTGRRYAIRSLHGPTVLQSHSLSSTMWEKTTRRPLLLRGTLDVRRTLDFAADQSPNTRVLVMRTVV